MAMLTVRLPYYAEDPFELFRLRGEKVFNTPEKTEKIVAGEKEAETRQNFPDFLDAYVSFFLWEERTGFFCIPCDIPPIEI